jgi:hypothetical protein
LIKTVPLVSAYYVSKGHPYTAILGFLTALILPSAFLATSIPYKTNDSNTFDPKILATLIYSGSNPFLLLGRALIQASANFSAKKSLYPINLGANVLLKAYVTFLISEQSSTL